MDTRNNNSSDMFKKAILADELSIVPDPSIEQRVNYYFKLQHSRQKVHQNSFAGFLLWLVSGKTLLLKTSFAAIVALFLMLKSPVSHNHSAITGDTCASKALLVDSNAIVKDTCFN